LWSRGYISFNNEISEKLEEIIDKIKRETAWSVGRINLYDFELDYDYDNQDFIQEEHIKALLELVPFCSEITIEYMEDAGDGPYFCLIELENGSLVEKHGNVVYDGKPEKIGE
jgi:hypothetical protein